jgi:hypothetical protein
MIHPMAIALKLIAIMILDERCTIELTKFIFTSENDWSYSALGHCVEWSP